MDFTRNGDGLEVIRFLGDKNKLPRHQLAPSALATASYQRSSRDC